MRPARDEGFVLVCVLWVLAILTVVSLGFGHRAALERRAAAYSLDRAQAAMMARAAVQRGIVEIRNKGYMDMLQLNTRGGTHLGQEWAKQKNMLEGEYFTVQENFENDTVTYIIEDMERHADINAIDKTFLENIEALSQSARREIWSRRTKGVHDGEHASPFIAAEELRYMRSVSDDDWYGEKKVPGLRDIVSVHGGSLVNFNTALPEVLQSVPGLKKAATDAILQYRAGGDGDLFTEDDTGFAHWQDLMEKLQLDGDSSEAIKTYCKSDSSCFKITGLATRRAGKVRVQCTAIVVLGSGFNQVLEWQEAAIGS